MSSWLTGSQTQTQPGKSSSTDLTNTNAQSDTDLACETSEQRTESDDNFSEISTTLILLEIRKDVKKMNKKFDHLETSVCQVNCVSKILKDKMRTLRQKVNELKSSVSKLESQNKEQEMKTEERLEAHSRRDNLWFYGFDDKID